MNNRHCPAWPRSISAIRLIFVLLVCAWFAGCTSLGSIAGNSADFGNAKVTGTLIDNTGKPSAGTLVRLVPQKYDGGGNAAFPADTTDASGAYSFQAPDTGAYNVEGVQLAQGTRVLRLGAHPSKTAGLSIDTMRAVGRARVLLDSSLSKPGARVVIEGTTYAATLTASDAAAGYVEIDSLPAQKIPPVLCSAVPASSPSITIYDNVVVVAGSTVIVDKRFSAAPSRVFIADTTEGLQGIINSLGAGDTMLLHGGIYRPQSLTISINGNAVRPIVIKAVAGEAPVVRASAAGMNLVNVQGASFLTIDGLEFDSTAGGDDVIKIAGDAITHDIIFSNCVIHDYRGRAINSQGAQFNISVVHCHIYNSFGPNSGGINVNSLDIHGVEQTRMTGQ